MPSFDGPPPGVEPDLMVAIIDLLKRSGVTDFQIRYDEEQEPIVWVAVALIQPPLSLKGSRKPAAGCGAGFTPIEACRDLAERVVTGGTCTHCGRMIECNFGDDEPAFPDTVVCYRKYKGGRFQRSCASNISN